MHGPPDGPLPFPPPHMHPFHRWAARRGPRVGRGDVRVALLLLLAEEPRNGYQIITEIERRSSGSWRPSPGSVYPALSHLEDQNLIRQTDSGDRKRYELTPCGRAMAERHQGRPPWLAAADNAEGAGDAYGADRADGAGDAYGADGAHRGLAELHRLVGQLQTAARQVAYVGGGEELARARRTLVDARRQLYRILAEADEPADGRNTETTMPGGEAGDENEGNRA